MVQWLLEKDPTLDDVTTIGETALLEAVREHRKTTGSLLLNGGAKLDVELKEGQGRHGKPLSTWPSLIPTWKWPNCS